MSIDLLGKLRTEEGFRSRVYKDTLGVETFGYGFTSLDVDEAEAVLRIKADKAMAAARLQFEAVWDGLGPTRQRVLAEIVYQLGAKGLAEFKRFKAAVEAGDHEAAAGELLDSTVAREQTPERWQWHAVDWIKG